MTGVETETLTMKELADYCQCSKIPIKKQLTRLQLPVTVKECYGRQVTAYTLTKAQLSAIRENIQKNKSGAIVSNTVTDNSITVTTQPQTTKTTQPVSHISYLDEYMKYKVLYEVEHSSVKLLEDRQGGLIAQNKELQTEKETLIKENATVTAELKEEKNKSGFYQKCLIVSAFSSVILLILVLIAVVVR